MDSISAIILAVGLIIIMLGMGLSLVTDDFKRIFTQPKAILIGLTNQILMVPLIGFALTLALPLNPEIAIGIMILAACPGGATSNLFSHLAKGDTALSVSLTAISSLVTIITIPFIVNFALTYFIEEGKVIKLDVIETFMKIMIIIVIPIGIGMLIRKYWQGFADRMERPVKIASGVLLAVIIIGITIKERATLADGFAQAGLAAFLLNSLTMIIGYFSAKLFKVSARKAISIAIESGIQNGTLAITVAVVLLGNSGYAVSGAIYSLIMFLTGGIAVYLGNRAIKDTVED